ncbi:orotidine-5'-phosphate decarboxylase [bacterium]|nr:orotidine-5'-phosphate decarboxylase [bacterium]
MLIVDKLISRIDEKSCPIVVGLDPLIEGIPEHIKNQAIAEHGNTLQGAAEALFQFNRELLEILNPIIPAVKLQMACYELYGQWGIEVFNRTVILAKSMGFVVIDDSKRNDIGSSASLYAVGHLGNTPLIEGVDNSIKADFLTINPFLGNDSITPFVEQATLNNKGLFILVRTSNPSAKQYQTATIGGLPLYEVIAGDVQSLAKEHPGENRYSSIGAVVGATCDEEVNTLRELMPNVFFLMPGYGAQGGTADQVVTAFQNDGYGAIVNSSRGIIFAYRQPMFKEDYPGRKWKQASLLAANLMRDDLLRSLKQAGKLPKNW